MALYADEERGKYPVWQTLDHVDFFPGSGIVFVTVTVCHSIIDKSSILLISFPPRRAITPSALRNFRIQKSNPKYSPSFASCSPKLPFPILWHSISIVGIRTRYIEGPIPTGRRRSSVSIMITCGLRYRGDYGLLERRCR